MIAYEIYSGKAPEDFGVGRKCQWCSLKVSRYTKRQCGTGPLLCSSCVGGFDPVAHRKGTRGPQARRKRNTPLKVPGVRLPSLRAYRRGAGKTQEWLDTAIDAYIGYIGKVERGIYFPSKERVERIAEALDVTVEDLREEMAA